MGQYSSPNSFDGRDSSNVGVAEVITGPTVAV